MMLILASAVLLARLDLHIRVVPSPQVMAFWMAVIVLAGIWLGHSLPIPLLMQPASVSI